MLSVRQGVNLNLTMPYRIVEPPTFQLLEFQCIDFSDEYLYGEFKKGQFVQPKR